MADWSKLNPDVLELITGFLPLTDIHCFAAVCQTWRLAAKQKRYPPLPQLPWLVLAEDEATKKRKFYNMSEDKYYLIDIPELRGAFCCGSSHGWLFVVGPKVEGYLVNPFTRASYLLPTLPPYGEGHGPYVADESMVVYDEEDNPKCLTYKSAQAWIVHRVSLSADPTECKDFVVLVILRGHHRLAFWKPGDEEWTLLQVPHILNDICHFNGKFYGVDPYNRLYSIELDPNRMARKIDYCQVKVRPSNTMHLVNVDDALLLVFRIGDGDVKAASEGCENVKSFRAFVLNLDDKEWWEVADLAGNAYFLGANTSLSVPADELGSNCSADSIYFSTHPNLVYAESGYTDLGLYHFEDETFGEIKLSKIYHPPTSLPIWLKPSGLLGV